MPNLTEGRPLKPEPFPAKLRAKKNPAAASRVSYFKQAYFKLVS
jgi:hypothetical protein